MCPFLPWTSSHALVLCCNCLWHCGSVLRVGFRNSHPGSCITWRISLQIRRLLMMIFPLRSLSDITSSPSDLLPLMMICTIQSCTKIFLRSTCEGPGTRTGVAGIRNGVMSSLLKCWWWRIAPCWSTIRVMRNSPSTYWYWCPTYVAWKWLCFFIFIRSFFFRCLFYSRKLPLEMPLMLVWFISRYWGAQCMIFQILFHKVVIFLLTFSLFTLQFLLDMLRRFCEWKQRFIRNKAHDVALLLTRFVWGKTRRALMQKYCFFRRTICKNQTSCATLGVAEVDSMCRPSGCTIVRDKGLSTSYTIAHEFGHTLRYFWGWFSVGRFFNWQPVISMVHDDDNKCTHHNSRTPHSNNIMSRTTKNDSKPFMWSPCSRQFATDFLE